MLRLSLILIAISLFCVTEIAFAQVVRSSGDDIGIRIVGTITNASSGRSVVLLKIKSEGRVRALKQGEAVSKGWGLIKIHPKYVMLQRGTNYHLVYQNKFAGDFLGTDASNARPALAAYKESGFERKESKITMTEAYRDQMIKDDLSKVLMQATAIPFSKNGQVIGFKLLQIDKDSIYDKAGFLNADVITAINGTELNSVAGAIKLLQSLRKESTLSIDYLRGDKPARVQININ